MSEEQATENNQLQSVFQEHDSARQVHEMAIAASASVIDELSEEFVKNLPDEMNRIEAAFSALQAVPDDSSRRTVLFRMVHDLKGVAGTFDYLLISVIGNDLCRFLERPGAVTQRGMKVIQLHVGAIKRVANERMTGGRDEAGLHLVDTLHRMTRKVLME